MTMIIRVVVVAITFLVTSLLQSGGTFVTQAMAADCTPQQAAANGCPPPSQSCRFLPFPVGDVWKPVVFFTEEGDDDCIREAEREVCPECVAWMDAQTVGKIANATVAWRLPQHQMGVWVPASELDRIKDDAVWCDQARSDHDEVHDYVIALDLLPWQYHDSPYEDRT